LPGVSSHDALAAAATLVSLAFALATLERWRARHRRHELAWTIALLLFAAGSAALWAGAAFGWGEWSFKCFYLFGAVANVPTLAVGTVYLLGGVQRGDRAFVGAVLFATFAAGWILAAPLVGPIEPDLLPQGKEVFGPMPRAMAAIGSGVGALVLFGGAVWSGFRLLLAPRATAPGAPSPRRLAAANGLIALGTLVLSAGGLLNSVLGEMDAFAVSLVVGISAIFAGFLVSSAPRSPGPSMPGWIQEALDGEHPQAGSRHRTTSHGHRPARRGASHTQPEDGAPRREAHPPR
jgi:hypothetical protein